jgi:hypothetical protein
MTSRWQLPGWLLCPALVHSFNVVDQRLLRPSGLPAVERAKATGALLAALLNERTNEFLGVGFKDAIDFVEQIVNTLGCG